ncbi:Uncharacterised protein [Mycobacterium tuberculosis]|nr:Uncharacterised protein [Mycobacterium tuberculosis]
MTFLPSAVSRGSSIGYLPSKQAVHSRDVGCSDAATMPRSEMYPSVSAPMACRTASSISSSFSTALAINSAGEGKSIP